MTKLIDCRKVESRCQKRRAHGAVEGLGEFNKEKFVFPFRDNILAIELGIEACDELSNFFPQGACG